MKTKQERFGTAFILFGIVLIGLCLALVLYNTQEDANAGEAVSRHLPMLQREIEARAGDKLADPSAGAEAEVPPDGEGKMPVVMIDGYGYIGYLSFPSLELYLPVMDQWDYERLKIAPCRYYGSLETEDLVIAGHNYRSVFGRLSNMICGDTVTFTDMNGEVHRYTVEAIEILNATDVVEMVSNGWNLSLYTCTYDGTQRYTLRCTEVKPETDAWE